jgi:Zn-dependent protease with chaperone function
MRPWQAVLALSVGWMAGCQSLELVSPQSLPAGQLHEAPNRIPSWKAAIAGIPQSHDQESIRLVEQVGRRLAAAAKRPEQPWTFQVLAGDARNVVAFPDGQVAVYEGLLTLCGDEAELAAAMAHEMAHVLAGHVSERAAADPGGSTVERSEFQSRLREYYSARVLQRPVAAFNARQESEADSMALLLLANAGYDPRAAVSFWDHMGAAGRPRLGDFAEHHGGHGNRGQQLQQLMKSAVAIYDSRTEQHGRGVVLVAAQTRTAATGPADAQPGAPDTTAKPAVAETAGAARAPGGRRPVVIDDGWRSSARGTRGEWVASDL